MALNLFIDDLYNEQKIVRDGVFPAELLANSRNFRAQCKGMSPRFGVWAHICGTDLVRDKDGTVYVLEDNLRVPSGVSYMLENRILMKSAFPELFEKCRIQPVDGYTAALYDMLAALSPRAGTARSSRCSRLASSIPPISSTATWRSRSVRSWCRARI